MFRVMMMMMEISVENIHLTIGLHLGVGFDLSRIINKLMGTMRLGRTFDDILHPINL